MNTKILLLPVLLSTLWGCTTIPPWERGDLAKKEMAWDPDPMRSALRDHIYFSKEGSSGGASSGGGGCGCN